MSVASSRTKEGVILGMGVFTERVLVTRRCVHALVEVMKEMNSNSFSEMEIDMIISKILHVFQSRDAYLKILCYSFIRNIADLSSGSFVAINALINSITTKKDGTRAESLRLLLQITPEQMLEDCAKYVHQSLIETEYKSLNLIVPVLLFVSNPSLSEWFSNISWINGLSSSGAFGNAVMLMDKIRPQDSREIVKSISSGYLKGYSAVVSVRYLAHHAATSAQAQKKLETFFKLENTDEASFIEAVRHLPKLSHVDCSKFVDVAVKGLKTLLTSQNTVHKIAALRTIEDISATQYKNKLAPLRAEIEEMLSKGSTVALISMSILLRIGTETMADKISKQLPKLMIDMGESQKLTIIESVGSLCEKFGSSSWSDALNSALHSTSSCAYKVKVVQTISKVIKNTKSEDLKQTMENLLCTYAEDSPYPRVTVEILGILIGKKTEQYTMCLMNRMLLDSESVHPAIDLSFAAEKESSSPLSILFKEGPSYNEHLLSNTSNKILAEVKTRIEDAAELFEEEKKDTSEIESKFEAEELKASKPIILNRTESEFLVSVSKHTFTHFIVLKYTVTSKIDFVLEEGRLSVFLEDENISEETLYLRGRESRNMFVKIDFNDFEKIIHKTISTTFGYSVNDNRDYEVGEVRLSPFEISLSDFISSHTEDHDFKENEKESAEFKFSMQKSAVILEMKKIFDIPIIEEDNEQFTCKGMFIFTKDPVLVKVRAKESGSKTKTEVTVCSANSQLRSLLLHSVT